MHVPSLPSGQPCLISGMRMVFPWPVALMTPDAGGPALAEVSVREGRLAMPSGDGWRAIGMGMWVKGAAVLATMATVGRFLIEADERVAGGAGIRVTADLDRDADPLILSQAMAGHLMGAILHLSGVLPMHACCMARNGVAVAFMASRSGGKSTLAAALHGRGWRPVADDLTALTVGDGGAMLAWPGPSRWRLSQASLAAVGLTADADMALGPTGKWLVPGGPGWQVGPVPLAAIAELAFGEERPMRVERLTSARAVAMLHSHVFRRRLIPALALKHAVAGRCLAAGSRLAAYTVTRPPDLSRLDEMAEAVERLEIDA